MALVHPRIARNFIRNGYFPTDEPTLEAIGSAIEPAGASVRILDPCCGEGAALWYMGSLLEAAGAKVESFGVEVDEERAWHAKTLIGTVAHADVHDVRVSERSFGMLFLNPPYGDLVADAAHTGDTKEGGRARHEKVFCRRTFNLLQVGGVLVLIVPFYVLDADLSTFIARHFARVQVFMSPEQEFKQCVLFGVKQRPGNPDPKLVKRLLAFAGGEGQQALPHIWPAEPYIVPAPREGEEIAFSVLRLDARQLDDELSKPKGLAASTLWPRFAQLMRRHSQQARRPLRAMSNWHLALALAAGQISGVITTKDGRRLLVKGHTHKVKDQQLLRETDAKGNVTETRVLTDRFVPVIKAIELTPGKNLGQLVTIV